MNLYNKNIVLSYSTMWFEKDLKLRKIFFYLATIISDIIEKITSKYISVEIPYILKTRANLSLLSRILPDRQWRGTSRTCWSCSSAYLHRRNWIVHRRSASPTERKWGWTGIVTTTSWRLIWSNSPETPLGCWEIPSTASPWRYAVDGYIVAHWCRWGWCQ